MATSLRRRASCEKAVQTAMDEVRGHRQQSPTDYVQLAPPVVTGGCFLSSSTQHHVSWSLCRLACISIAALLLNYCGPPGTMAPVEVQHAGLHPIHH